MNSLADLNKNHSETDKEWTRRLQAYFTLEIEAKLNEGHSSKKILLLIPPVFLERLFSVIFACPIHEARVLIVDERKKKGYLSLFGAAVISNESVLYPGVEVLSDLREARKRYKVHESKLFGGRILEDL